MGQSTRSGLTPHLVVNGAVKAIEFYKKAFGAVEVSRMPEQNGPRLMHAELKIGDASLMLCDDFPEYCGGVSRAPKTGAPATITLHMDVSNCDAAIDRALTRRRDGEDAGRGHVLGRPLRPDHRPVRARVVVRAPVDRRANRRRAEGVGPGRVRVVGCRSAEPRRTGLKVR